MLIVVVYVFDVFISAYVFVYTQTFVDVGDLPVTYSRYFVRVSGLVIVVALTFVYCS